MHLLPGLKEYDALISLDTYMTGSFIEPINKLKNAVSIPVITMGTVKEGTYSIVNDQDLSFREIIEHLIDRHGCRDFVHVAGPRERSFCQERIDIFQNTLADHGLGCRDTESALAVFLIDMNGMKKINDRYGHAEGDFCLTTIADALQKCARLDEICIRMGGDEFVVLAKNYDQKKADVFMRMVQDLINQSTRKAGKNYQISVSIGCYMNVPEKEGFASIQSEAETYLGKADKEMYSEKQKE